MCLKESLPIFTNVAKVNFKIDVLPFIVADNYQCFYSNKRIFFIRITMAKSNATKVEIGYECWIDSVVFFFLVNSNHL
jgi:hypothetical protein